MTPIKGQLVYIRAMAKLSHIVNKPLLVLMAGHIDNYEYYQQCVEVVEEEGLGDNFLYLGELNNASIVLSQCDIVCVCTKMEAFGRTVAEAMASGCLVLAPSTGGVPELLCNGDAGYLYGDWDDSDSLAQTAAFAIDNPEESVRMAIMGQKHASSRFTETCYASATIDCYMKAISKAD